jgi:hypothetical protein
MNMNMLQSHAIGLTICAVIATSSFLVSESLWYLGNVYWLILVLLALAHIVVSGTVFIAKPSRLSIRLGVVTLLILGQWWAIKMLTMLVIWRLRGFAP